MRVTTGVARFARTKATGSSASTVRRLPTSATRAWVVGTATEMTARASSVVEAVWSTFRWPLLADPALHCNACGREVPMKRAMGRSFRVCSIECVREMEWRHACMILNKPYTPSPETLAWATKTLGEDGA